MDQAEERQMFRIGVSARHVHLTQDTVDILFGKGHVIEPDGPGGWQFKSTTRVDIVGPRCTFSQVAVMGPCRDFNQFELSVTECRALGIPAVIRMSGDIEGSPGVKLVGTAGEFEMDKGAIVAKRHIHMGSTMAESYKVQDGDTVLLRIESEDRTLIFDDTVARTDGPQNGKGIVHIDTDEGNAAGIGKNAQGYIIGRSVDFKDLFA